MNLTNTPFESEPPSIRQRIAYISHRNSILIIRNLRALCNKLGLSRISKQQYFKYFKLSGLALSLLLIINLLIPKSVVLSASEKDKVDLTINKFIDPINLGANLSISNLQVVSKANSYSGGTGGPDEDAASPVVKHTVAAGETLSGIANSYGMSSGNLVLANKDLQSTELIHIGQVLVIPAQEYSADELAKEKELRAAKLASETKTKSKSIAASISKTSLSGTSQGLIRPVNYSYVSQSFSSAHHAEDMVAPYGSPIKAAKSGCIISAGGGWNGGYGNLIVQDLGGGVTARYAHLSAFADGVSSGVCVEQGTVIGYLGSTGHSTGPHLHFELRKNNVAFNPGL